MAMRQNKLNLIRVVSELLEGDHPQTLRQIHYALVSRHVTENTRNQYQALSRALVDARMQGIIPWPWIEDRTRRPRGIRLWQDLSDFAKTMRNVYRKSPWDNQNTYVEVWLEKDALSGYFEDVLEDYGVILNVGRGYDGWSSIHQAARRFTDMERQGHDIKILYYGDFDPSGEDMVRSLADRLQEKDCTPDIAKCAITADDIEHYNLPPIMAKAKDSRTKSFEEKHGRNACAELDALGREVLKERLRADVEAVLDMESIEETWRLENRDLAKINALLDGV